MKTIALAAMLLVCLTTACKKDASNDIPPPPPDPAPPAPANAPAAAGTPAGSPAKAFDKNLLVGTWTKSDNAKVTWKFEPSGVFLVNTSTMTNNKGTWKVDGMSLHTTGDQIPAKDY